MSIGSFLVLLVIAGACGAIGSALAGRRRSGCFLSVVVGFIGAYLGEWLAARLEIPTLLVIRIGGHPFPVVWSIIGSALLLGALTLLTGRRP